MSGTESMSQMVFGTVLLLVFNILQQTEAGSFADVELLYNNMLQGYNKNIRPLVDTNTGVDVRLSFQLVTIKEMDEVNGKLSVVGFFELQWREHRITWNPWLYNHTYILEMPENDVWTPEITLANPYDKLASLGKGFMTTQNWYSGDVYWYPGDVMSATCPLDVTYYPFDNQVCTLQMISWGYAAVQINLITPVNKIKLDYYNEHGTWELINTESLNHTLNGLPLIYLKIHMRRRSLFYTINVILPVMFMVILNILVFALPVESGERISYSITVLLALAVFMTLVGENLPKTSKPMSILGYFLLADLILSALICFFTIYGLNVYFRDDVERPVPPWIKRLVNLCRCRSTRKHNMGSVFRVKPYETDPNEKSNGMKDMTWDIDEEIDRKVTWKLVSKWLDSLMMAFSVIVLIVLKASFFALTMSSK